MLTRDRTQGLSEALAWSVDGSRLYYDRHKDSPVGVFTVPALGGEERLVVEDACCPAAVPDGSLIVSRINADRQFQLHRFWPSTGRIEPLAAETGGRNTSRPAVLAGGRRTAFYGRPLGPSDMPITFYGLDLDSGAIEALTSFVPSLDRVRVAAHPSDGSVLLGGYDGNLFRILRVGPASSTTAETLLTFPTEARFDVDSAGALYTALVARRVELVIPGTAGSLECST
ncbi:MAG: TolB family protein [Acidobacteriota bacterium]